MIVFLLILGVISCYGELEFSTRPTNISWTLLNYNNQTENGSVVLGTFGIWNLMAGLSFGASHFTKTQIDSTFFLSTDNDNFNEQYRNLTDKLYPLNTSEVKIWNENYLFVDKDNIIHTEFKNMFTNYYKAKITVFDFEDPFSTADQANQFIENNFPESENIFVADDFKDATLILSNVLWFEGYWSKLFNISHTKLELVDSSDGRTGTVNMMQMRAKVRSSHIEGINATVTELPYGNDGKYCMLLINATMTHIYYKFDFREIFEKLQSDEDEFGIKEIDVKLPRFAKRSNLQLRAPIYEMGIYDAFQPNYANFNKITVDPIYITSIEHNAVVMVAEIGTIAYATTPGKNRARSNFMENEVMPPLVFFIMEKPTATVLFAGAF